MAEVRARRLGQRDAAHIERMGDITRKKHTGEAGNGGQFGSKTNAESPVQLSPINDNPITDAVLQTERAAGRQAPVFSDVKVSTRAVERADASSSLDINVYLNEDDASADPHYRVSVYSVDEHGSTDTQSSLASFALDTPFNEGGEDHDVPGLEGHDTEDTWLDIREAPSWLHDGVLKTIYGK